MNGGSYSSLSLIVQRCRGDNGVGNVTEPGPCGQPECLIFKFVYYYDYYSTSDTLRVWISYVALTSSLAITLSVSSLFMRMVGYRKTVLLE